METNGEQRERGRPPKEPEDRKGQVVQIRLTAEEKFVCESAAGLDESKMSAWARNTLVNAAQRRLRRG